MMKRRDATKLKHVWMVEEAQTGARTKSFWTKIGVAFENDDGSLSLQLAAVPVTGRMIIRDASQPLDLSAPSKTRGVA